MERVLLVEMPSLAGLQGGALAITRAVVLKNLGVKHAICREEDGPLAALVGESAVELGIVAHGPLATFVLPSGGVRSSRTLPSGREAEQIAWAPIQAALAGSSPPDERSFSRAAWDAWVHARG